MHEIAYMKHTLELAKENDTLPSEVKELIPHILEIFDMAHPSADALCDAIGWHRVIEKDCQHARMNFEKRLKDAKNLLDIAVVKAEQYAKFRERIDIHRPGFDHRYESFLADVREFARKHGIPTDKAMAIIQDVELVKKFYGCVEIEMYFTEWYFKQGN